MRNKKGIFIAFEGIDGSGKSTQAAGLLRKLRAEGLEAMRLREPTRGKWGQRIREMAARAGSLSAEEQLDLFIKDRNEDVEKNIEPALQAGKTVIIDRYYFSTMAYQGAAGLDVGRIRRLNEKFAPRPDLVFIFEVPVAEGLARISARGPREELFEREDHLERVAAIFRGMTGRRFVHIDGSADRRTVGRQVLERVHRLIEKRAIGPSRD